VERREPVSWSSLDASDAAICPPSSLRPLGLNLHETMTDEQSADRPPRCGEPVEASSAHGVGSPDNRLEYVKAMIDWADSESRQVYIRVTAAVAVTTLFVTQIPIPQLRMLDRATTHDLFFGLGCFVASAGLYFLYVDRVHIGKLNMVRLLKAVQGEDPDAIRKRLTKRWLWALYSGDLAFVAGFYFLARVLYALVAQH
jgi:hypothetical protein